MKIALTGASGLVGRAIAPVLRGAGHDIVTLGRRGADIPFDLSGDAPSLAGCDALVHCGFAHAPGKYRGGEGDDPDGFIARNHHGSIRLFDRAVADGVGHVVFLSSRAVYGDYPPGTALTETMVPRPDTLYGRVKWAVEQHMQTLPCATLALRATGVYAPGPGHKWTDLFAAYLRGDPIPPRIATEVHGHDLAQAVAIGLALTGHHMMNVSDILLDRRDLLSMVRQATGCPHAPPAPADPAGVSAMTCDRLRGLGWRPGGMDLLRAAVPQMIKGLAGTGA